MVLQNRMRRNQEFIAVSIRSFLLPDEPMEGFRLGERFQMNLAGLTTLGEFTQKFFHRKANHIGMIAVNGLIASENTPLSEGDQIDLYPLLEGG